MEGLLRLIEHSICFSLVQKTKTKTKKQVALDVTLVNALTFALVF